MLKNPIINTEPINIKRALISVFDKKNVIELATCLHEHGVEIISSGGTASEIDSNGISVIEVDEYTGFPEILDGRVKTLNPFIAGGILNLRDIHSMQTRENKINNIDLVICNLYPFLETIIQDDVSYADALENIDIGGPTMIRAAAKNVGWVCVVVDPLDYKELMSHIRNGTGLPFDYRSKMSRKAFSITAEYESTISQFMANEHLPDTLNLTFKKFQDLRYGENPQQMASVYQNNLSTTGILNSTIHQGKDLSYNNIMDADAAVSCVSEFKQPGCVVIKHANPCGAAVSDNVYDSFLKALNADRLSAFGGIVALNRECTTEIAKELSDFFIEIIVAPSFTKESLEIFSSKKNLRVIELVSLDGFNDKTSVRNINGGLLLQETDTFTVDAKSLKIVTDSKISPNTYGTIEFGWTVLKYIKSNGILIVKNNATLGVGAGQVSRVDSVDIAITKASGDIKDSILLSDAFFPFRDSIDKIAKSGIRCIIQPGGSKRDQEVIDACNEYSIAMAFTGARCFNH